MNEFTDRVDGAVDLGPVPFWAPTQKTPAVIGEIVEYRSTDTRYGRMQGAVVRLARPAVVRDGAKSEPRLAETGELIAVWIKGKVLQREWYEPSSGGGQPLIGDTVGVKLAGEGRGPEGPYPIMKVFVDRDAVPARQLMPQPVALEESFDQEPEERLGPDDLAGAGVAVTEDDDLPF